MDFRQYIRDRLPHLGVAREADIVEELAQHLEDLYHELRSSGLEHDDALARAVEALTPAGQTAADLRSSSGTRLGRAVHRAAAALDTPARAERPTAWLGGLHRDVRHALRGLLRTPGFTAITALTLALGIGATSVVYSGIDALLLAKPPVRDPGGLVHVFTTFTIGSGNGAARTSLGGSSYPDYVDLRDSGAVAGLAAFSDVRLTLDAAGESTRIEGAIVTGNYFDVLGVAPALGRVLTAEDDSLEEPSHVVVLGHRAWQDRFGGRSDVVGQTVRLNGSPYTIVGVAPPGFNGPRLGDSPEAFVPMALQPEVRPPSAGPIRQQLGGSLRMLGARDLRWLNIVGRLHANQSVTAAASALDVVGRQIAAVHPQNGPATGATAVPLGSGPGLRSESRQVLALLGVAVSLVLSIACANVASLLLARGLARGQEVAVRMALGAGRAHVARQWLVEAVLLGVLGAVVGLAFAAWGVRLFHGFGLPPSIEFGLNARVLALTLVTGIASGLVFGLAPVAQFVRRNPMATLRDEGGFAGAGGRAGRLRGALVVVQVALSFVLLLGAGVFVRALQQAYTLDLGYSIDRMLLVDLSLGERYSPDAGRALYAEALERIGALPGVESAGAARVTVLSGSSRTAAVSVDGEPVRSDFGNAIFVRTNVVSGGYLEALGVPIVRGRGFELTDHAQAPAVAIVARSLAERLWPGADPVGKTLTVQSGAFEVIGVVPDTVYLRATEAEPLSFYYTPLSQMYENAVTLHVRTAGDPLALLPAVRQAVLALDSRAELTNPRRLVDEYVRSMSGLRTLTTLASVLSSVAILLAAVGLYGVMAYFVRQRLPEVALRVALGATHGSIAKLVLGRGAKLVLLGAAIGVGGAVAALRVARGLPFKLEPTDPVAWIAVGALLAAVGVAACAVPAWRALRVAPAAVLRNL
jgi:predicted permease